VPVWLLRFTRFHVLVDSPVSHCSQRRLPEGRRRHDSRHPREKLCTLSSRVEHHEHVLDTPVQPCALLLPELAPRSRGPQLRHDITSAGLGLSAAIERATASKPPTLRRDTFANDVHASSRPSTRLHNMASPPAGLGTDARATSVHTEETDPYATMGQFSFAPATKTTVVTTTYTTTTTFPPLCVNAPGSLGERDPKEYPLAHVQAPDSIRKIYFDAGGELACFEEADAASSKLQEVRFVRVQGYACHLRSPCSLHGNMSCLDNYADLSAL
jgi:hypothetical protein